MCLHLFLNFDFIFPVLNRDRSKLLANAYDTTDKTKGTVSKNLVTISVRFSRLNPVCLCVCVYVCVSIIRWSGLDKLKFCILFSWIDCHDCRALEIFADFSFERPKRFRLRSLARKAITQWGATTTKTSFEKNVCVRYSNVTFQLFSESLRL